MGTTETRVWTLIRLRSTSSIGRSGARWLLEPTSPGGGLASWMKDVVERLQAKGRAVGPVNGVSGVIQGSTHFSSSMIRIGEFIIRVGSGATLKCNSYCGSEGGNVLMVYGRIVALKLIQQEEAEGRGRRSPGLVGGKGGNVQPSGRGLPNTPGGVWPLDCKWAVTFPTIAARRAINWQRITRICSPEIAHEGGVPRRRLRTSCAQNTPLCDTRNRSRPCDRAVDAMRRWRAMSRHRISHHRACAPRPCSQPTSDVSTTHTYLPRELLSVAL